MPKNFIPGRKKTINKREANFVSGEFLGDQKWSQGDGGNRRREEKCHHKGFDEKSPGSAAKRRNSLFPE